MAEIFQYRSGLPSFAEILDIISRWSERGNLVPSDHEIAKEELESCLMALETKSDGMSGMVRGKIKSMLALLGPVDDGHEEVK